EVGPVTGLEPGDLGRLSVAGDRSALLVLGVLAVPELVPGRDDRDLGEVVLGRRIRVRHPLDGAGVPGIETGGLTPTGGADDVDDEHKDRCGDDERADGRDEVPEVPPAAGGPAVDAPGHA